MKEEQEEERLKISPPPLPQHRKIMSEWGFESRMQLLTCACVWSSRVAFTLVASSCKLFKYLVSAQHRLNSLQQVRTDSKPLVGVVWFFFSIHFSWLLSSLVSRDHKSWGRVHLAFKCESRLKCLKTKSQAAIEKSPDRIFVDQLAKNYLHSHSSTVWRIALIAGALVADAYATLQPVF